LAQTSANIRSADSLNAFNNKLKLLYQPPTVPNYFETGERFAVVHHTRIKKCSNLNYDLYCNNLRQSPMCDCGVEIECRTLFFSDKDGTVICVYNFFYKYSPVPYFKYEQTFTRLR